MTRKTRVILALLVLLVGLPLYIAAALFLVSAIDRPPLAVELAIYLALGVLWALPFRSLFRGLARKAPDAGGAQAGKRPNDGS